MDRDKNFYIFTFFLFFLLLIRLFQLQVLDYSEYKVLSSRNFIRIIPQPAQRGNIFDRDGEILAEDTEFYSCVIYPQEVRRNKEKILEKVSSLLDIPQDQMSDIYAKNFISAFLPVVIKAKLTDEEIKKVLRSRSEINGIDIQKVYVRNYPSAESFSNVLGYISDISHTAYSLYRKYGLDPPQRSGSDGIEKMFDSYLQGQDGGMQIVVDSTSKGLEILSHTVPRKGNDIYLTLDKEIQEAAYSFIQDKRGALIFGKINGEILAMASSPGFDSQKFIDKDSDYIRYILNLTESPLINRCVQGIYPPGSTFKPIVAVAAFAENKILENTSFTCGGSIRVGRRTFKCWSSHGSQSILAAIQHSCNVFFYRTGMLTGASTIASYAKILGLGRPTSILINDQSGLVPTPEWKRKRYNIPWTDGDTCNLSIGQGYVLVTPMQMFRVVTFLASGRLFDPFIVKKIETMDVGEEKVEPLDIDNQFLDLIRLGMRRAVSEPSGTVYILNSLKLEISAKTGTAQTYGRSHAWVIGFFPYENPQYIFVVLLEHGGSSSSACVVARNFLKSLLKKGIIE